MTYAADEAVRDTQREANKDTGAMADGIHAEPVIEGGDIFYTDIVIPADYAGYVVFGTAPHVIRPKSNGGVLVFEGGHGGTVFAKEVHHPGYAGNDFFYAPMPERFQRSLEEAIHTVVTQ